MLTVLLGKHLQPSPGSPYLIEREPHCFQFTEEPKYVALTGVSRAVKEGEKISGDQYAMLESEKGRLLLLLSDGTGAGEDASRGSGRVLDLMEKMLEAVFDTEESVNMLRMRRKIIRRWISAGWICTAESARSAKSEVRPLF